MANPHDPPFAFTAVTPHGDMTRPLTGEFLSSMGRPRRNDRPPIGGGRAGSIIPSPSGTRMVKRQDASTRLVNALLEANARLAREVERADRQAREAVEARRRQASFLVTIAHELRNPLLPLRLAARSLAHAQQDPGVAALLATINNQVDHIGRLINDLLDCTAADAGHLRLRRMPILLGPVLETAVAVCRPALEARHHLFTSVGTSTPLPMHADPVRLVQVFVNLLDNAAKYTPEGGRISLECERRGNTAVVTIRDNGVGIRPSALPRLFDMYGQEEIGPGGLGIGLALVKQLVVAHGGSVAARSAGKGAGSAFEVTLPCD